MLILPEFTSIPMGNAQIGAMGMVDPKLERDFLTIAGHRTAQGRPISEFVDLVLFIGPGRKIYCLHGPIK
jgi:hypothetical protein